MLAWLALHWVAGALMMAVALLAIVPLAADTWSLPILLIYLASPTYMLHQVEEHTGDHFRSFVNTRLFDGVDILTTFDVIWINVGAVWAINLAALYFAWYVGPGWALAAPYLLVVNALVHIATIARTGTTYNPGLVTAVILFLPLGLTTLKVIAGSPLQHIIGLGIVIALHALMVVTALRRAAVARRAA
jgi:hypothetical protein